MSEYSDQQAAIVAILEAIPDIGNVHPRPRIGDAFDLYVATIGGQPIIRAWEVGIGDGIRPNRRQQGSRHRYTNWLIRGYHSLDDDGAITGDGPSYDRMLELAYAAGDALDADQTLTGTMLDHTPTEISSPDALALPVIGGGSLCWTITLSLTGYTVIAT